MQRIPNNQTLIPPPEETGLRYLRPLASMGFVQAVATSDGAALLLYEHRKAKRQKKRWIAQARLRVATLNARGQLVPKPNHTLFKGPRAYGYIEGHIFPSLLRRNNQLAYLGRSLRRVGGRTRVAREGWLLPSGSLVIDGSLLGTDPSRMLDPHLSESVQKHLTSLAALGPRLHPHQRLDRSGRIAWLSEDDGVFWKNKRLWRTGIQTKNHAALAHPFPAKRLRLHWATQNADGHGLAASERGLSWRRPNASLVQQPQPLTRTMKQPLAAPVRIGNRWWGIFPSPRTAAGARLMQVWPYEPSVLSSRSIYPDASALVGGEHAGLLLQLAGNVLSVSRLLPTGKLVHLGRYRSGLRVGFQAIGDGSGGAIVVSPHGPKRVQLLHVDARGKLRRHAPFRLRHGDKLQLVVRPGGALLWSLPHAREVVWIDGTARALGRARWSTETAPNRCWEGAPPRIHQPALAVGSFETIEAFRQGPCLQTPAVRTGPQTLRWFGNRSQGLDLVAVAGSVDQRHGTKHRVRTQAPTSTTARPVGPPVRRRCPPDMVQIGQRFCIDRFEAQLVDSSDGVALSPFFPSTPRLARIILGRWVSKRFSIGPLGAQAMPLPPLLRSTKSAPTAVARSRAGVLPSGYLTGHRAKQVCEQAGKRLCLHSEWRNACRGEENRKFPYGDSYRQGACNVHRFEHPAKLLHADSAIGHLDPRLSLVQASDGPLLRPTGTTPTCASHWGDDAVYDMVGNLDEWVEKKSGAFAGGFYARATKRGCEALITVHPRKYLDYSLGVRCCKDIARR